MNVNMNMNMSMNVNMKVKVGSAGGGKENHWEAKVRRKEEIREEGGMR
jgi:hypothetical protein